MAKAMTGTRTWPVALLLGGCMHRSARSGLLVGSYFEAKGGNWVGDKNGVPGGIKIRLVELAIK